MDAKKRAAMETFLTYESAGDVNVAVMMDMGANLEGFLRFVQIPEPRATQNLKAAQGAVRKQLARHATKVGGA